MISHIFTCIQDSVCAHNYYLHAVITLGLRPLREVRDQPPLIFGRDIPYQQFSRLRSRRNFQLDSLTILSQPRHSCLRPPLKQKHSRANSRQLGKARYLTISDLENPCVPFIFKINIPNPENSYYNIRPQV